MISNKPLVGQSRAHIHHVMLISAKKVQNHKLDTLWYPSEFDIHLIFQFLLAANLAEFFFFFKFINALQHTSVLKVCRTPGPTACLKMLRLKICLKSWQRRKKSKTPGSLEPAAIQLTLERLQVKTVYLVTYRMCDLDCFSKSSCFFIIAM